MLILDEYLVAFDEWLEVLGPSRQLLTVFGVSSTHHLFPRLPRVSPNWKDLVIVHDHGGLGECWE